MPQADYIPSYADEIQKTHQRALVCNGQVAFWQLVLKFNMYIFVQKKLANKTPSHQVKDLKAERQK